MAKLTERRKADRAKMADAIATIANEFACEVEIEREGENSISPRRVQVTIRAPRGLACAFDFDGETCQPDVFVNPWHIGLRSDACLSDSFPGSVNGYHFQKSTTVARGFDALCEHVRLVLSMARDGTAFDAGRETRRVSKHGTWQEQQAKWDEYRAEWAAQKAAACA